MIVNAPFRSDFQLAPGEILTVVADGVSSGSVARLGDGAGGDSQGVTAIAASATKVFGPYNANSRFEVVAAAGFLTATQSLSFVSNPIAGGGPGYKVARGTATLSGTNPTAVATGLSTIAGASVVLKQTTAPGLDPAIFTQSYSGSDGTLNIYAWKFTSSANPTLIASTNNSATVDWIAFGT